MPTRHGARLLGTALVSSLAATAAPALANGRFPASNQIVFSPASPGTMVGRTTFGFLPSVDDGTSWRWVCEDVLALPSTMTSDPELALTAGGALVAGTPTPYQLGVSTSTDLGCNWSCGGAPVGNAPVADIVLRYATPHAVLALRSAIPGEEGGISPAQLYETTDDGATWKPKGVPFDATDASLEVYSVDVARSDAMRIYVSATRGTAMSRRASIFESKDDGQSWTEHSITQFDPSVEGSVYIGAVDPTDADRIYVRSAAIFMTGVSANASCAFPNGSSRLFASSDGGATFTVANLPITTCQILGFAVSSDGSRVYAGTYGDGLFAASKADLNFSKTSSIHVECLATRNNELWACSDETSGFIFGSSTDEGACFTAKLPSLVNLAGPISCAPNPGGPLACLATHNASACGQSAFLQLCDTPFSRVTNPGDNCFVEAGPPEAGCGGGADGGATPDAGTSAEGGKGDGGTAPQASAKGGCGCDTVGSRDLGGLAGLGAAALALAAAASRRRRRG